jgi:hypothetical protein
MKAPPSHTHYVCIGSVLGKCAQRLNFCKKCHPEIEIPKKILTGYFKFRCDLCRKKQFYPLQFLKKDYRYTLNKCGCVSIVHPLENKKQKLIKYYDYISMRLSLDYDYQIRNDSLERVFFDENDESD